MYFHLVLQYQEKQAKLARLEKQLSSLREEKKSFIDNMKKEKQINNLLFEQNILEMAQHVLRYYDLNDKVKVYIFRFLIYEINDKYLLNHNAAILKFNKKIEGVLAGPKFSNLFYRFKSQMKYLL